MADIWDQAAKHKAGDGDIWDQAAVESTDAPLSLLPGNSGSGPTSRFVSNLVDKMNPGPGLMQAGRAGVNETLKNVVRDQGAQFSKAGQAVRGEGEFQGWSLPNRLSSAAGYSVAGVVPLVGPAAARAGEQIGSGDVAGGLGSGAALVLPSVLGPSALRGTGRALESGAVPIAESALGVRSAQRAYGKTPGRAILTETSGVSPASVGRSARERLSQLNPELEAAANNSTTMASTGPTLDMIRVARLKAQRQNAPGVDAQLEPMETQLTTDSFTKQPIPSTLPARQFLDLKRGFSNENVTSWNPTAVRHGSVNNTAKAAYGSLDRELDHAVPEAAGLNQRISSLIPVAQRAEEVSRNAPISQRVMHRVGAHTGALLGAAAGYEYGGAPGALAGAILPEMLASPTAQMIGARSMYGLGRAVGSKPAQYAIRANPYASSLPRLPDDYNSFSVLPPPIR